MNNHVELKSQRSFSNLLSPIFIFIVLLVITLASALPVYIVPTTPASGGHQESLVTIGLNVAGAAKAGCTKECDYDCIPGPNGGCIAQKKFCWWECPPAPNPPTITSTLICSEWGSNNWCKGTLSIKLTATEPQNFNVLIDGDINGIPFTCPAQAGTNTCTLPLSEGTGTVSYTATSVTGESDDGSTDWQLDSAAPTLSGTLSGSSGQNGWFISNDLVLDMSASDPLSGLASLTASVDGGPPITTTSAAITLADGSHTIVIVAADQAGNIAQSTQTVNVDTLTPMINQSLLGTMGNNNWYITPLQISANPSDATSGITLLEASVDGGVWTNYISPITLSDGHHTWQFRATDYAGNVNTTPQQEAYIDATTPNISTSITGTTGNNGWYTTNVQVSATASDSGSGINSLEAATDGGAYQSYTNPIVFSNGTHTYQFRATDSGGNVTVSPAGQVKVDLTSPSLSINVTGTKGNHGWYISDASIAVTTNEGMSGIAAVQAKTDNSAWAAYTTPLQFSDGIHIYQFQVTDNASNTTRSSVLTIRIDTIAPIVDIQDKWKVEDAVGYSAHDDGSGLYGARLVIEKSDSIKRTITDDDIQGVKFSNELTWDGWFNNGSKADEGDYPAEMKVADAAGNETVVPSTVSVDFSVLSLLPSIPFLGSDDPTPQPEITPDDQLYTFGDQTSDSSSGETSSSNFGGETNTNLDKLESVELEFGATKMEAGETSTFGFSNATDFIFPPEFFNTDNFPQGTTTGNTTSAILLSILAAAGLGTATAGTSANTDETSKNVVWGAAAEEAKDSFADQVKQWIWDHSKHPGNASGAGAEENDGPKSYREIEKEYQNSLNTFNGTLANAAAYGMSLKQIDQLQDEVAATDTISASNNVVTSFIDNVKAQIKEAKMQNVEQADVTRSELLDTRQYQDWVREQKLKVAEYADMTKAEKLAAYEETPEYQNYRQGLVEYEFKKEMISPLKTAGTFALGAISNIYGPIINSVKNASVWTEDHVVPFLKNYVYEPILKPLAQANITKIATASVLTTVIGINSLQWVSNVVTAPQIFDPAIDNSKSEILHVLLAHPTTSILDWATHPFEGFSAGYDISKAYANSATGFIDAVLEQNPLSQDLSAALQNAGDHCLTSAGEIWARRCSAASYFAASVILHPMDTLTAVGTALGIDPLAGAEKLFTFSLEHNNPIQIIKDIAQKGLRGAVQERLNIFRDPSIQPLVIMAVVALFTLVGLGIPAMIASGLLVLWQTASLLKQVDTAVQAAASRADAMKIVTDPKMRRQIAVSAALVAQAIYGGVKEIQGFTTFKASLSPAAQVEFSNLPFWKKPWVFENAAKLGVSPEATEFYLAESALPDSPLAGLSLKDALRFSSLVDKYGMTVTEVVKVVDVKSVGKLSKNLPPDVFDYIMREGPEEVAALSGWSDKDLAEFGPELALRAEKDAVVLKDIKSLVELGPVDPKNVTSEQQILIKQIAKNSTQYDESGQIVLGKWVDYGNGFAHVGRETGSAHYNPHPDMWNLLGELGKENRNEAAWLINKQVIQTGIEKGLPFEYTLEGIKLDTLADEVSGVEALWTGATDEGIMDALKLDYLPIRMQELKILHESGYQISFDSTTNSYVFVKP